VETVTRPIFLLTDFGLSDSYVGQVRAVISGIAPAAPLHDLTHEIEPYSTEEAAWMLECALPALPAASVVMAVVDPGVGTARRALALRCGERDFVGPDNGILSGIVPDELRDRAPAGGGSVNVFGARIDVRELTSPRFRRPAVSATFHGRDIFAPAAAHLAIGLDFRHLGPPLAEMRLFPPFRGEPLGKGALAGRVVHVDHFGNLVTTIRASQAFPSCSVEVAGQVVDSRVRTFAEAEPGSLFCYVDSSGFIAIAVNQGSAAREFGVARGAPVLVRSR
jgi:S-adenosylmethionine hydrolase